MLSSYTIQANASSTDIAMNHSLTNMTPHHSRSLSRAAGSLLAAVGVLCAGSALATGNHTAAQFAVTESGAATLTVPIQVPRGIGGMEPQLALNYSTGAGNGLLGLGWSLSGPSAITRCPKTILHDGERGAVTFGIGDRFCLDGQRLMPSNRANTDYEYGLPGTEYRTDKDVFSRITGVDALGPYSPAAPASFKVETKSGLVMHFGLSDASRVRANDPTLGPTVQPINRWMLQRIADRNGSYVEFAYCRGEVRPDNTCDAAAWQGSTVLHYIRYTNRNTSTPDGTSAVVFIYEARPDKVPQFHYGAKTVQTQRIKSIDTYVGFAGASSLGQLVRRYSLAYDDTTFSNRRATNASRLITIQESDGGSSKLPPLEVAYMPDLVLGRGFPPPAPPPPPPQYYDCNGQPVPRPPQQICH